MSAQMHLGKPEHLAQLLPLVAAMHDETGIASTPESRESGIAPLLDGGPLGAVYLIGPIRAPMGYAVVTFTWSVEFGGMDCFLDEIYIRPAVRGRGIAFEAINDLARTLGKSGVRAMHLEVARTDEKAQRLYARARFRKRDSYILMGKEL